VGVYVAVPGGGEEEVVQQVATATPAKSLTTAPTASPAVEIPADWQTYVDPKGRFLIRIPPDWRMATFSTVDNPSWLQLNIPGESEQTGSHTTDGVKLSVSIEPKRIGETLEGKLQGSPEAPQTSFDHVTVNGRGGARATWRLPGGTDIAVGYVFERGSDWVLLTLVPNGPQTEAYIAAFDTQISRAFIIP
jgi:hypothetical protein